MVSCRHDNVHGEQASPLQTISSYVAGHVFGTVAGTGTFTASFADGSTVVVAAPPGAATVAITVTDRDGRTFVANTQGTISFSPRGCARASAEDHAQV